GAAGGGAAGGGGRCGDPDLGATAGGSNTRPPLADLTTADWDTLLAVNLTAPFLLGQRFGPQMADRGWGRIVNIASQQAVRAFGNSGGDGAAQARPAGPARAQPQGRAPPRGGRHAPLPRLPAT